MPLSNFYNLGRWCSHNRLSMKLCSTLSIMAAAIYKALQLPDPWAARHDCQPQAVPRWLFDKFLKALLMLSPLGKSVGHSLIVDM